MVATIIEIKIEELIGPEKRANDNFESISASLKAASEGAALLRRMRERSSEATQFLLAPSDRLGEALILGRIAEETTYFLEIKTEKPKNNHAILDFIKNVKFEFFKGLRLYFLPLSVLVQQLPAARRRLLRETAVIRE